MIFWKTSLQITILVGLLCLIDTLSALSIFIFLILSYKSLIAWCKGYKAMSIQDNLCLFDDEVSVCNCASNSYLSDFCSNRHLRQIEL